MSLSWNAASDSGSIDYYTVFRDGRKVDDVQSTSFDDTGLKASTEYRYQVSATDVEGRTSDRGPVLVVSTKAGSDPGDFPPWAEHVWYAREDGVTYDGVRYVCIQEHTSNRFWLPPLADMLWAPITVHSRTGTRRPERIASKERHEMTRPTANRPRHGHVSYPQSRAAFAIEEGKLNKYDASSLEAGKFFPATASGLRDPVAPSDQPNNRPPADGQLASGGFPVAAFLDEPGTHWRKHAVRGGETIEFHWAYTVPHPARRWSYFITRPDWNPHQALSRDQFEDQPFQKVELLHQPYWDYNDDLMPPEPTKHTIRLPDREGYHVILAIWEVADTGNAFYQVVDFDFEAGAIGARPNPPHDLRADEVTTTSIRVAWQPSRGEAPIVSYSVYRNEQFLETISASELEYPDRGLEPNTEYRYTVLATDVEGRKSDPSEPLIVRTRDDGVQRPPTPPGHLHSMEITAHSVRLMWGDSTGTHPIEKYLVHRDGKEVGEIRPPQLEFVDSSLAAETEYRYFVAAVDTRDWWSLPSNIVIVRTTGESGHRPEWATGVRYEVGDEVSYGGKAYRCYQAHTSNPAWTPVETINVLWISIEARRRLR